MKKFLTVLLVGGLMVTSIFAFNQNAPRVNQDQNAVATQQVRGGFFDEESLITVTGVIESIEENEEFPGMLEIIVKTDDGEEVELHANAYFTNDLEVGKTIEVKGFEIVYNDGKIFKPVQTKVDGKEVVLNGFRGATRGMRANVQMPGYAPNANQGFRGRTNGNFAPRSNMRQAPGNLQMPNNYYGQHSNGKFVQRGFNQQQMPGYQRQNIQQPPMPRGRW